jgi:hypothetical protein
MRKQGNWLLVGVALTLVMFASQAFAGESKDASKSVPCVDNTCPAPANVQSSTVASVPATAGTEAAPVTAAPVAKALEIVNAVICTDIQDREPVGAADSFAVGTLKLYCYTKITGANEGDEIIHVWKKGSEEMARVTLKLGGSPWRTRSSKNLAEDAAGTWTVDIMSGDTVLKTLTFEIK